MRFGLLGPIQVLDGQRPVPVPAGRVRALLAVLLLRANQVISVRQLADYLGEPSAQTLRPAAVQTYVGRLRRVLGKEAGARLLRTTPTGYMIELRPDQLDLTRFRELVRQAAAVGEPASEVALLTEALALWRGQPMADMGREPVLAAELLPLLEERMHAVECLMAARLRVGQHAEIVPDLARLCHEHPLREQFWAQLMLAYQRSGRQAEALRTYQTVSRQLADELGISPGIALRRLHQSILSADTATTSTASSWRQRCQLPPSLSDFVGRELAMVQLVRLLQPTDTVPIVMVCGVTGIGKSALAVRVAHRLRPAFPDGQWYVRLVEPDGTARDPFDVLAELLDAAGISAPPSSLDQRAAALRATLADRRVLLMLDEAHDAAQIRPLLPGTAGNAVLITSSRDLTPLVASHGGHTLTLDTLAPAEAHTLLTGMLGAQRVNAEPAAVAALIEHCAYLPLRLRTAGAHLATRPGKPIAAYVGTTQAR